MELKSIIEFESNSLFKKLYKELVLDIATMNTLENRNKEMVTWAYWADIIRYAALTKYGGIYCDPKTKIIKKLGTAESNFKVLTGHCDDVILKTPIGSPATTGLGKKEFINNDYLGCIKNSKIMKAVFEGALTKTNNMIAFKNGRTQLIYPTFGHRGKYTYRNTGPQHLTMTYLEAKSFPQNPFTLKEFLKTFAAFSQYRRMSEDVWSAMDDKKLSIDKSLTPSIFEKSESDKFTVPGGYKVSWGGKREAYPIHAQAVNILQTSQIKAIKSHIVSAKNEASSSNSSKRFVTSLHDAIINATKMKRFREVGENMYEETGAFSAEILFEIEQRVKEYKAEPEYNALNPRIKALIDTIEEELDPENHVDAYIKNYITVNKLCKKKTDGQLTNTRSTFNPKNEAHKRRHPNLENPDVLPAEIITGLEKYCEDDRKRDN
ncbi:MAG: hypothetical protein GY754_04750 [bacterium]|nr:hypothetical protein [bacterium]